MVGGAVFHKAKTMATTNDANINAARVVLTHADNPSGPSIPNPTNRVELNALAAQRVTMISTSFWVRKLCRGEVSDDALRHQAAGGGVRGLLSNSTSIFR